MLLMDITTVEPEKMIEVNKRWELVESMDFPKGLKIIGQWVDAGGARVFTLYNVETIEDYMAYNLPFADLCKVEVFPVIDAGDFRRVASECIEKMSKISIS